MALNEESEEEYHSLGSADEPEDGADNEESETMEPPVHPVSSMQGPFEESIIESAADHAQPSSTVNPTAEARRQELLECKQYDDSWAARWKQNAGAQYHPLLKLMAQIIFGMHLLQQEQAKSEGEVVKILQTHVNEVDSFLERTAEDFNLAIRDIEERIRFLKLPMKHQDVFDIMLDDKKFRTQLLEGNDKIEKIIDRTSRAMKAAQLDVQKGVKANKELGRYLESVSDRWPKEKRTIADVYGAMRGNEQGWRNYLTDLHLKGNLLGQKLVQLGTVIGEMSKLAAAASRRNKTQSKPTTTGSKSAPVSPGLRSKFSQEPAPSMPSSPGSNSTNLNKPLPSEPQAVAGSSRNAASPGRPVPFTEKYERPRQAPPSPNDKTASTPTNTAYVVKGVPQRPKTAAGSRQPKDARAADTRNDTADLAAFLKDSDPDPKPKVQRSPPRNAHLNPLRSNPPDATWKSGANAGPERKLERSTSQGADLLLTKVRVSNEQNTEKPGMLRSRSQGAMDVLKGAENGQGQQVNGVEKESKSSSEQSEKKEEKREIRTGFARRLSKRMKHLPIADVPPPTEPTIAGPTTTDKPISDTSVPPPADSAYSSGTDRTPHRRREPPKQLNGNRPDSTVGPLPSSFAIDQLPDATNNQHLHPLPRERESNGSPSVKSLASTSKSRSLNSIKSIFQGRFRVSAR